MNDIMVLNTGRGSRIWQALFGVIRVIGILTLFSLEVQAALHWENKQIGKDVDPLEKSASVSFLFRNIGETAVTITQVKPNCGCTTAALIKKTYEPGESGEIVATLTIGGRQGRQSKTIQVKTDDTSEVTVLIMNILIPRAADIKPSLIYWKRGEAPVEKTVEINAAERGPIHLLSAESSNDDIVVLRIEELARGAAYRVHLKPKSTDTPTKGRVSLELDVGGKPATYYVHAHVK